MLSRKDFVDRMNLNFSENSPADLEAFTTFSLDDYRTEKILISAALHRIEEDISVQVAGSSGKTALVKHLFNDALFRERFLWDERLSREWDERLSKDLHHAKGLSSICFGRVGEPGLILYDTPTDMVTLKKELTHMRNYCKYERGARLTDGYRYLYTTEGSTHIEDKPYLPYFLEALLNSEALSCLFVVDAAADVTDAEFQEELQSSIAPLRERFKEEKVVFVKMFETRLMDTWDAEKRARRENLLDTLLGTDAISFDETNADGLFNVAFALLKMHGAQGKLAEHMLTEMKCQRVYAAAQEISDVIFPAFFFSEAFTTHAYSEALTGYVPDEKLGLLPGFFSFVARFLIHRLYTETVSPELENRLEKRISAFTDALVADDSERSRYYEDLNDMGVGQRLLEESIRVWQPSFLPGEREGLRIRRTAESLAKVFYFTYTLIYEIENENEPLQGARAMVTETEGIQWFTEQFKLSFKDEELWRGQFSAYEFYTRPEIHMALEYFLRAHHPEFSPVFTPTPGVEKEISAYTGGIGVDDSEIV